MAITAENEVVWQGEAVRHARDKLLRAHRMTEPNEHESYLVLATATELPGNWRPGEVEV